MPVKSQQQRKFIFAKRGQYGDEKHTPKEWKWVWEPGWENKGKLPKRVKKKKKNKRINEQVLTFEQFINEEFN